MFANAMATILFEGKLTFRTNVLSKLTCLKNIQVSKGANWPAPFETVRVNLFRSKIFDMEIVQSRGNLEILLSLLVEIKI